MKEAIILDLNGRPLLRRMMDGANTLDVSSLSDGVYVLVLETEKVWFITKL